MGPSELLGIILIWRQISIPKIKTKKDVFDLNAVNETACKMLTDWSDIISCLCREFMS